MDDCLTRLSSLKESFTLKLSVNVFKSLNPIYVSVLMMCPFVSS